MSSDRYERSDHDYFVARGGEPDPFFDDVPGMVYQQVVWSVPPSPPSPREPVELTWRARGELREIVALWTDESRVIQQTKLPADPHINAGEVVSAGSRTEGCVVEYTHDEDAKDIFMRITPAPGVHLHNVHVIYKATGHERSI